MKKKVKVLKNPEYRKLIFPCPKNLFRTFFELFSLL